MDAATPSADVRSRIERVLGAPVVKWRHVARGYSPAGRWLAHCADGVSAFIKVAGDAGTARALRIERRMYRNITADFTPRVLGWDDGEPPILALEDLSAAHWPPPWSDEQIARVRDMLRRVAATPPHPIFPRSTRSVPSSQAGAWCRMPQSRSSPSATAPVPGWRRRCRR